MWPLQALHGLPQRGDCCFKRRPVAGRSLLLTLQSHNARAQSLKLRGLPNGVPEASDFGCHLAALLGRSLLIPSHGGNARR